MIDLASDHMIECTTVAGQKFSVPLNDFYFFIDDLRDKCSTQKELCIAIQAEVHRLNDSVMVTVGEADDLSIQIGIAYTKKKQRMLRDLGESQRLVSSTASGAETERETS